MVTHQSATRSAASAAAVAGLTVDITGRRRWQPHVVRVLDEVSIELRHGEITALIGESGCGKSMLASALVGLLPPGSAVTGTVRVGDQVLSVRDPRWRDLRGRHVGLVPQSPVTSFTPVRTLESQLAEVISVHRATCTPAQLCDRVRLPADALGCYPHELSGGMAQRAAVAAAITGSPTVIVADEPTSALDPALAQGIWDLLGELADDGAAVLVITHDMDALRRAERCSSIAVMRRGALVAHESPDDCMTADDAYVRAFFEPVR
ncbi:ATP-binding cassette domain-containing protein [Gordonia sp. VNQ95]|uniref:ATP-binding cassette domain-containing protein n=1 Tax=Gordonia sp. VNQ95 TaxID=3156619 RepID=UPI0032B4928F